MDPHTKPAEAQIKAATISFIKTRMHALANGSEERLLARLQPAARTSYVGAMPISWVPMNHADSIYAAAAEILYPGVAHPIRELGRDAGRASFSSIYRVLLRVLSVPYIMEQAAKLWHTLHTHGDITAEKVEPNCVLVTVSNHPSMGEAVRESAAGQFAVLVELTGARDVQVVRDDRPPVWRWRVSWS